MLTPLTLSTLPSVDGLTLGLFPLVVLSMSTCTSSGHCYQNSTHSINSFYSAPVPRDQLASEPPAVLASPGQRWDLGYHAGANVYYWSL